MQVDYGDATTVADASDAHSVSRLFPLTFGQPLVHLSCKSGGPAKDPPSFRIGVVFCGRQSPGGHNVICGIYDAIKYHSPKSKIIGFCGGTEGLFMQKTIEITEDLVLAYRNQGVTSNTDAAQLAETFADTKCQTRVVGVPVTLYGDLKNQFVEADVGFDTICKVILSEEVPSSKLTLFDITKRICDAVQARAEQDEAVLSPSVPIISPMNSYERDLIA
ncbi:Pyrophosphate--fructose 6-phosphate 1-phosphotransferase subunit alpha [Acorus calamus]|uniref:Pyrophosphate--fructose 6-phosphate 1-phosphotransferase subunit alpha n=1 Tax=Acorus calamus TaxID=4465 RepID=A0AAV9FQV4_ACOCL|nr:Pyrophosphate--fructose 6-phosphate 1-phosphotransferase subunit alpha [Acorus calamus]